MVQDLVQKIRALSLGQGYSVECRRRGGCVHGPWIPRERVSRATVGNQQSTTPVPATKPALEALRQPEVENLKVSSLGWVADK